MLLSAICLLIATEFPFNLNSHHTRFILGLLASTILGLGCLILGGPVPVFVAVLAIVATLPRVRDRRPSFFGFCLIILYVLKRIICYFIYEDKNLKLYEVCMRIHMLHILNIFKIITIYFYRFK
jgi:hypothetical protein